MSYSHKILLIVVSCLFLQLLNAQNFQKIDSLELSLEYTKKSKDKVEILLNLSNELQNNDPDKALEYAKKANSIAEEIDYENGILNSMITIAEVYRSMADYKEAMEFATKSKELAEESDAVKELALSLHIIGEIYINLEDYDKSAKYFFKCLKLSEQINYKKGIGESLSSIGSVYFMQSKFNKALEYYFRSLNLAKETNDYVYIARGLNNIAAMYGSMGKYGKARQYIEESLEFAKELENKQLEGINYSNLGKIYMDMKNYDSAIKYYEYALPILINLKNPLSIAGCQINIGYYYLEINEVEQSLEYATVAFEEGKKHGLKAIVYQSAELLGKIYLRKNDTLNAFKYDIIKYQVKDSLDFEESIKELSRLELQYEFNRKEQEKRIEQQRKDLITLIIIISLIFILIVIVLIFARQKIKAKNIQLVNEQLESKLEFKNKELTMNVMYLMKKNEMLSDISKRLIQVGGKAVKDETKAELHRITRELQKSSNNELWEEFELRFKQIHSEFYNKLLQKFPELTPNEQKLCAFLHLNMSTKEISELTGQSVNTIEKGRFRLRKKLRISSSQINLITFLSQIN